MHARISEEGWGRRSEGVSAKIEVGDVSEGLDFYSNINI